MKTYADPEAQAEIDRLRGEIDHVRRQSELRRAELYGGIGTCAGEKGWITRAQEAETQLNRQRVEVEKLKAELEDCRFSSDSDRDWHYWYGDES